MSNALHIVPVDDLVEHELSDDCVCGPAQELVHDHWLVTHHSLDGREIPQFERPPLVRDDTEHKLPPPRFTDPPIL